MVTLRYVKCGLRDEVKCLIISIFVTRFKKILFVLHFLQIQQRKAHFKISKFLFRIRQLFIDIIIIRIVCVFSLRLAQPEILEILLFVLVSLGCD